MMFKKRGQSALEFLTTYGWAFLVILIMVSALAYLGILNPSNFLGNSCTTTPGFYCNGVTAGVSASDQFQLELINREGGTISISAATWAPSANNPSVCTASVTDSTVSATAFNALGAGVSVAQGQPFLVVIDCNGVAIGPGTHTGELELRYTKAGTSLLDVVKIQIRASP